VNDSDVTNILHRETLAMIAGGKTFKRGEECWSAGRVLGVDARSGELAGIVKPNEVGRAAYEIRIWVREDGLAYQCSCPVGTTRQFCKHAVAVTLAHLAAERARAEKDLAQLRQRLMSVSIATLLDGLVAHARLDRTVLAALEQITSQTRSPS
jgi:uncharacterized Zn finger protein